MANNNFKKNMNQLWQKTKQLVQKFWKQITAFFAHMTKREAILYIFYIMIGLSVLNIWIMTMHKLDQNYTYPILKTGYVSAVYQGQDVNQVMYTDIVKIRKFNPDKINVGDSVVIYSDFGIDEYWVESIVNVDDVNQTVEVTYDQLSTVNVAYGDITGTYTKSASFFGTIYYTARYTRGYILLIISHGLILSVYYLVLIDRREDRETK